MNLTDFTRLIFANTIEKTWEYRLKIKNCSDKELLQKLAAKLQTTMIPDPIRITDKQTNLLAANAIIIILNRLNLL